MFDAQELADKYVAVWNEADAERRRQQIAARSFEVPRVDAEGRILADHQYLV